MGLSFDTSDLAQISRSPWSLPIILVLVIAGVMWLLVDRVITREDDILAQGARVEIELAMIRGEVATGLQVLANVVSEAGRLETHRADRWFETLDRLGRLSAAQCYTAAGVDSAMRARCEQADVGLD